jgi:phage tail sheath protein FI
VAEYLAPGVYVEETSFRSRSIEGVSTSTTGMVGPTRTGPDRGTPELITSFGDFERIYGGLADLSYGVNYLAHSVLAYFNEGGSRLYISRSFQPAGDNPGIASSAAFVAGAAPADQARFVSRFPGAAGNGGLTVRQTDAPATVQSMNAAPEGTMLRVGGSAAPAGPARLEGGRAPFSLPDGGRLLLTVGGTDRDITFRGQPAEATANDPLPDNVPMDNTNNTLVVTLLGVQQTITLPAAATPRADVVAAMNREIRGGYARLAGDNRLIIGSDQRGTSATIAVNANATLGFTAAQTVTNTANANNNVADLLRVTADEINALLIAAGIEARAALQPNGLLLLSTTATGAAAALAVRADAGSVHTLLGLTAGPAVNGTAGAALTYYMKEGTSWMDSGGNPLVLTGLDPTETPAGGADFLTLTVIPESTGPSAMVYEDMGFDRRHPRYVGSVLAAQPGRRAEALENRVALAIGANVTAFALRAGLFAASNQNIISLTGGNDGVSPTSESYRVALTWLEPLEDISIVAAPGASSYPEAQAINNALIIHAGRRRAYRIAVLDTPPHLAVSEARTVRSRIDSHYAALYYPWVTVANPLAQPGNERIPREINLPPSGFVCGIYARNDVQRGVHKAPANEVVLSAIRFETDINFAEQELLNPLGINCLRFFSGRGYRVWGARTASSDPEWKYVNVRRYFNYLEASIDRSTQWAVFEPNGERLWANIRETVSGFLYNEWISGALLGASPKEAFFVKCDRSTMTQNDLDNGRLICLIGVAALKPAEFVIFRIGQKTADTRS